MKAIFAILFSIQCLTSLTQPIRYSVEDDQLEISPEAVMAARLNGVLSIHSLVEGGTDFDILEALGEPIDIKREEVENVGYKVTYFYKGLELHYSAMSNPELHLQAITISDGSELVFNQGVKLRANSPLISYIDNPQEARFDAIFSKESEVAVLLGDTDQWIRVGQKNGKVKKLTIFLGNDN